MRDRRIAIASGDRTLYEGDIADMPSYLISKAIDHLSTGGRYTALTDESGNREEMLERLRIELIARSLPCQR